MCKAYVTFKKLRRKKDRKTDIWVVNKINSNTEIEEKLGVIMFKGAWRQFVFESSPHTDWSWSCLQQIVDFVKEQNKRWRNKIKNCKNCKNCKCKKEGDKK